MSKSSMSVMSKNVLSVVAMAMGSIVLDSEDAFAKTVAVGPASCQPGVQHYATIQAAVNALASVSAANIINVCPGTYPEQITITQPTLTIKGVADGTAALTLITVPAEGLVPNVTAGFGAVAAQIGATAALGTKLINLTVDGTGATCGAGVRGAGVALVNIGDKTSGTSAGTITNVVVRNQLGAGCASDGILSDNSYVAITGSIVHDVTEHCIRQIKGEANINNNAVRSCTLSGIWLDGTTAATVANNVLFNNTWGIKLLDTVDCTVSTNTVGPWVGTAIYVINGVNTGVVSNKVKEAHFGIWVNNSKGSIVRLNSVQTITTIAIADVDTLGNNTFTNNTITEAKYGFYTFNFPVAIPDTLEPNTFQNVVQTIFVGSPTNPFPW